VQTSRALAIISLFLLSACTNHDQVYVIPQHDSDLPTGPKYLWAGKAPAAKPEGKQVSPVAESPSTGTPGPADQIRQSGRAPIGEWPVLLMSRTFDEETFDAVDAGSSLAGMAGLHTVDLNDAGSFGAYKQVLVELDGCEGSKKADGVLLRQCMTSGGVSVWIGGGGEQVETANMLEQATSGGRYFVVGAPIVVKGNIVVTIY